MCDFGTEPDQVGSHDERNSRYRSRLDQTGHCGQTADLRPHDLSGPTRPRTRSHGQGSTINSPRPPSESAGAIFATGINGLPSKTSTITSPSVRVRVRMTTGPKACRTALPHLLTLKARFFRGGAPGCATDRGPAAADDDVPSAATARVCSTRNRLGEQQVSGYICGYARVRLARNRRLHAVRRSSYRRLCRLDCPSSRCAGVAALTGAIGLALS